MDAQDADVAHLFERLAVPVASYRVFDKSKTASLEGDWPLLRAIEKASQAPASASPSLPFRTDMRTIPAAPSVVPAPAGAPPRAPSPAPDGSPAGSALAPVFVRLGAHEPQRRSDVPRTPLEEVFERLAAR